MSKEYRADIDGLRAVAVIPVLIFHAFHTLLPGGYLGVDVFFVISGFLITGILLNEMSESRFSFAHFYERRARRILPALFAMMGTTFLLGFILLPQHELRELGQSMLAVSAFLANVFFYTHSDYFASNTQLSPLLHTWSLAVEEQYYFVIPIFLLIFWNYMRKWLLIGMLFIMFLSVTWMLATSPTDPMSNFYLPFSRAWEIMTGGLVAYFGFKGWHLPIRLANALTLIALGSLLLSYLFLSESITHPGPLTFIPVIATAVILSSKQKRTWVARILRTPILIWFGTLSYSLYLWHQPVLAFLKSTYRGVIPSSVMLGALFLSLLLAWLSYRFIEQPYRNPKLISQRRIYAYSFLGLLLMTTAGISLHIAYHPEGPAPFKKRTANVTVLSDKAFRHCHQSSKTYDASSIGCKLNGDSPNIAVWGDSHAISVYGELSKVTHNGVEGFSFSGCPLVFMSEVIGNPHCSEWQNSVLSKIESSDNIDSVFLVFRHSYYLYGSQFEPTPPKKSFLDIPGSSSEDFYWRNFEEAVRRLADSGKHVILLHPTPEIYLSPSRLAEPYSIFHDPKNHNEIIGTTREEYLNHHKDVINRLDKIAILYPDVETFTTYFALCDMDACRPLSGGVSTHYDNNHLSLEGAKRIVGSIAHLQSKKE